MTTLDTIEQAHFETLVGGSVAVDFVSDGPTMLEVSSTRALGKKAGREAFSVVFREPGGAHFPQQIYGLHHPDLGVLHLFLVPIGPGEQGGFFYEAVFA